MHLLGAHRVHLLADDALDVAKDAEAQRQPGEPAGRGPADVAGPDEQPVAGDLGVGRSSRRVRRNRFDIRNSIDEVSQAGERFSCRAREPCSVVVRGHDGRSGTRPARIRRRRDPGAASAADVVALEVGARIGVVDDDVGRGTSSIQGRPGQARADQEAAASAASAGSPAWCSAWTVADDAV